MPSDSETGRHDLSDRRGPDRRKVVRPVSPDRRAGERRSGRDRRDAPRS